MALPPDHRRGRSSAGEVRTPTFSRTNRDPSLGTTLGLTSGEYLLIDTFDKFALLWGEAQKKIAYSYLKVT